MVLRTNKVERQVLKKADPTAPGEFIKRLHGLRPFIIIPLSSPPRFIADRIAIYRIVVPPRVDRILPSPSERPRASSSSVCVVIAVAVRQFHRDAEDLPRLRRFRRRLQASQGEEGQAVEEEGGEGGGGGRR